MKEYFLVVTTRRLTFYQKFNVNIAYAARAEQVDETILNTIRIFDVAGPEQAINWLKTHTNFCIGFLRGTCTSIKCSRPYGPQQVERIIAKAEQANRMALRA